MTLLRAGPGLWHGGATHTGWGARLQRPPGESGLSAEAWEEAGGRGTGLPEAAPLSAESHGRGKHGLSKA